MSVIADFVNQPGSSTRKLELICFRASNVHPVLRRSRMRPLCCLLLIFWLMLVPAMAQSPFDGVWKVDLAESPSSTKIYSYLLQDNKYRCTTCDPALDI